MAEFPALPLFTDAFISDTTHLDATETGAYLMLLIVAWRTEDCALPNDDKILARYARLELAKWKRIRHTVLSFWKLGDDGKYRQGRLSDERSYVLDKSNKNSIAGKASALKRKNRASTTEPTEAQHNVNQNSTPTPTPTPNREIDIESISLLASEFDDFWLTYPSKNGSKKKALESYQRIIKKGESTHATIIEGARRYAESCRAKQTEQRYIAHAVTWLNQQRWTDDYSIQQGLNFKRGDKAAEIRAAADQALRDMGIPLEG